MTQSTTQAARPFHPEEVAQSETTAICKRMIEPLSLPSDECTKYPGKGKMRGLAGAATFEGVVTSSEAPPLAGLRRGAVDRSACRERSLRGRVCRSMRPWKRTCS